ncbi:MAG: hypothetical protein HUJ54_05780 [Erysipelotrichaceae bacterium]|nr:hypothetical protein [Erysipelotrichaceae bacterium]
MNQAQNQKSLSDELGHSIDRIQKHKLTFRLLEYIKAFVWPSHTWFIVKKPKIIFSVIVLYFIRKDHRDVKKIKKHLKTQYKLEKKAAKRPPQPQTVHIVVHNEPAANH